MSNESREHLSSFMDGEVSKETSRFLVRRLGADGELRGTWARYHLIRDCLRHQEGDLAGIGLCGRIQQALASETPQKELPKSATAWARAGWSNTQWLKPVAGMAIAASVALMAIMTVGPGQTLLSPPTGELAGSPQVESFVSPNNELSPGPRSQQVSVLGGSGNSSRKMNSYLLRHYQMTGTTGGKGFVTFVPIVVTQAASKAGLKGDPGGLTEGSEYSQGQESLEGANESAHQ